MTPSNHTQRGLTKGPPRPRPRVMRYKTPLMPVLRWLWACAAGLQVFAATGPSIARVWDEEILAGIRMDRPNPPVHARNLFHLSAAMYDVWAAYDPVAVGYLYHSKHPAADVAAARRQAISFAAYRILAERYALSRAATNTLPAIVCRKTSMPSTSAMISSVS